MSFKFAYCGFIAFSVISFFLSSRCYGPVIPVPRITLSDECDLNWSSLVSLPFAASSHREIIIRKGSDIADGKWYSQLSDNAQPQGWGEKDNRFVKRFRTSDARSAREDVNGPASAVADAGHADVARTEGAEGGGERDSCWQDTGGRRKERN